MEYATPETLLDGKFSVKIDIWSIGLILYEIVHGHSPFQSESLDETVENITKGAPLFSTNLSPNLLKLLRSLLAKDPSERPEIHEIFTHPWILQNLKYYDLSFLKNSKLHCNASSLSPLFKVLDSLKISPLNKGNKFKINLNS